MFKITGSRGLKVALGALAVSVGLGLTLDAADARAGKGFSFGSRGSRTFTMPRATPTTPGVTAPMQKSITQPSAAARPTVGAAQSAVRQPSMFRNLFLGGLVGAALAGIFGVGAFSSVLGFLLQTLLIGGLIYMAIAFFRGRSQTASAGAGAGSGYGAQRANYQGAAYQAPSGGAAATGGRELKLQPADFDAFERLLGEIQTAYGNQDRRALASRTTPEMLSYFTQDLDDDLRRGVENRIAGVKLLQGDLSEAWSEGSADYATVAMRYSIIDVTVDKSGRIVDGSMEPAEATEVWTFTRRGGSGPAGWELSAIQQSG